MRLFIMTALIQGDLLDKPFTFAALAKMRMMPVEDRG